MLDTSTYLPNSLFKDACYPTFHLYSAGVHIGVKAEMSKAHSLQDTPYELETVCV